MLGGGGILWPQINLKAKEILSLNNEFLTKITEALEKKGLLVMADIKAIKDTCKIATVAL